MREWHISTVLLFSPLQNYAHMRIFVANFRSHFVQKIRNTMKPTFRPVVYAHHKRADGSYNVKVNVYFNGKERRLPTNIYCTQADLTRTHHIKSNDILSKCNTLISQMQDAIADISPFESEGKDVDWLVARIKGKLMAKTFRLDFFEWAELFLSSKRQSTRASYDSALNAFAMFCKGRQLDINLITRKMVLDFVEWCEGKPKMYLDKSGIIKESSSKRKKGQAAARYVARLSAIFNAAKAKYNDEDEGLILISRSPFSNIEIEVAPVEGQKPLPVELVQQIINDPADSSELARFAFDMLIVSFALRGANFADLWLAKPPQEDMWIYRRAKTERRAGNKAELRVKIPECIKPHLARLGAGQDKDIWLPALRRYKSKDRVTAYVNRYLKVWCKANDVEEFSSYAFRKSWATLARRFEDKALVDEAIGHTGGSRMLDIYAEKPYERYHELNEKVLALFEWE